MPLSLRQNELLSLAGTVRLPNPYPATGSVTIVAFDPQTYAPEKTILQLTHRIGDRLDVARLFRLLDVRAIRALWPSGSSVGGQSIDTTKRVLLLTDDVISLVHDRLRATGSGADWLEKAAVYLPESTSVVLHVEAAQTAAESADYYPPLTRGGSLHTFLCDDEPSEGLVSSVRAFCDDREESE